MFEDRELYGSEDQTTDMNLIDSRAWPEEPQEHKDTENYIEQYAAMVNKLRKEIAQCALCGKDAGELIQALAQAEENLDKWIDVRVKFRQMEEENEPLQY